MAIIFFNLIILFIESINKNLLTFVLMPFKCNGKIGTSLIFGRTYSGGWHSFVSVAFRAARFSAKILFQISFSNSFLN